MKLRDDKAYSLAGVDIGAADKAKELIKPLARSTYRPEVLADIGLFGGLFQFTGYRDPVLVSSVDGVGTKLKISALLGKHDTIGADLVSHCVNDILACGAAPLFFLDYIAMGKLVPETVEKIVGGIAGACRDAGCALIGGETAEMPGVYETGDYDLAGFIVGAAEKSRLINGSSIVAGDVVLGLPSSGLHTNGYSLVRQVFGIARDPSPLHVFYRELGLTLGEALLEPHRCYYSELEDLLPSIKGLAHITGGGFVGNLPRILPPGLAVHIEKQAWTVPPLFRLIQKKGGIEEAEMYRVFNMGIGMAIVCSPEKVNRLTLALPEAKTIGNITGIKDSNRLIIT